MPTGIGALSSFMNPGRSSTAAARSSLLSPAGQMLGLGDSTLNETEEERKRRLQNAPQFSPAASALLGMNFGS